MIEDIGGCIARVYELVAAGDAEVLRKLVHPEAFLLGSGPEGGVDGPDEISAWAAAWSGEKVESRDLHVEGAPSGRSAWVWDQIEIGRVRLRLTLLVADEGDGWRLIAGHVSIPIPNSEAAELIRRGSLRRSFALEDRVGAGAEPVAELYRDSMGSASRVERAISDRDSVIAFGSAADEIFEGGAAIKNAWHEYTALKPQHDLVGGVRAGLSPDGELAWAASNLDITIGQTMHYRFFLIYLREGERWKIVGWHDSYPVEAGD